MSGLERLLAPQSVAVLGASDDPVKPGGRPIAYMRRAGYTGAIYPVNPARAQVQGLPAYASLAALPGTPDVAVIAVASKDAGQALDTCIEAGVKSVVLYTAGYAEAGEDGAAEQAALLARARAAGLRLLGPNTQGHANFATGAILNFSGMLDEFPPMDGPIAVISQSGAGGGILWNSLRRQGLGLRYLVATGNEADISVGEMAAAVLADETISLVLLYIESMRDPAALAEAARSAARRGVPLMAVKAGRTQAGQLTASSHTGALASEEKLVDAFLRQHGILRLDDFDDMVQCAQVFSLGLRARGRRLVSISNSGASCVLAADAADDEGLVLPQFDGQAEQRLRELLPVFVTARNPIDMSTAMYTSPGILRHTLDLLAESGSVDLVQIGVPAGVPGVDFAGFAAEVADFMRRSGVPVAISVSQQWVGDAFLAAGVPVFRSERAAMRALALLARFAEYVPAQTAQRVDGPTTFAAPATQQALNEADSMAALDEAGLPTVARRVCTTAHEVREAVAALGAPVVVKGLSAAVTHKSEMGLVRLNQIDAEQAVASFESIRRTLADNGTACDGALVASQVPGEFELSLGAHLDPVFGPVVMVGQGGILVESVGDVQFLVAPFTEAQACAAIERLHIARSFVAARGREAVRIAPIAQLLVNLGDWMCRQAGRVASVDANPLIVSRGEVPPVIVDAVVMLAAGEPISRETLDKDVHEFT